MKNWLDKTALRLAYKLIAFTRPMFDDINDDAKLQGAQRFIDEVYMKRYLPAPRSPAAGQPSGNPG